jgi:hypothetical protein
MSFYDRKQERELQIELLRVQLKYERENALFSALMGVGVSLVVFALAFSLSIISAAELPVTLRELILNFMSAFFFVGGLFITISIATFLIRKTSEKNELKAIQEKFVKDDW